jgi:hypothetical protein
MSNQNKIKYYQEHARKYKQEYKQLKGLNLKSKLRSNGRKKGGSDGIDNNSLPSISDIEDDEEPDEEPEEESDVEEPEVVEEPDVEPDVEPEEEPEEEPDDEPDDEPDEEPNNSSFSPAPIMNRLGFTETLKRKPNKSSTKKKINPNICPTIFMNNHNANTLYYYPSEFPNLTKIKSVPIIRKGGKRTNKRIKNNKSKKRKHKKFN